MLYDFDKLDYTQFYELCRVLEDLMWSAQFATAANMDGQPATGPFTRTEYALNTPVTKVARTEALGLAKLLDYASARAGIPLSHSLRTTRRRQLQTYFDLRAGTFMQDVTINRPEVLPE